MTRTTYASAHMAIRAALGAASTYPCLLCQGPAEQWAFQGCDEPLIDKINGLAYSTDPRHYEAMCKRCHRALDRAVRRSRMVS